MDKFRKTKAYCFLRGLRFKDLNNKCSDLLRTILQTSLHLLEFKNSTQNQTSLDGSPSIMRRRILMGPEIVQQVEVQHEDSIIIGDEIIPYVQPQNPIIMGVEIIEQV
ncbi:Uncharacterized protein Fot_42908 [Forsythia ovata]|uniref:Uncharacterized protein n=1 Tax=Forsythia ovata TaxID=205694 RepID=A0ABD1RN71_9LAMI